MKKIVKKFLLWLARIFKIDLTVEKIIIKEIEKIIEKPVEIIKEVEKIVEVEKVVYKDVKNIALGGEISGDTFIDGDLIVNGNLIVSGEVTAHNKDIKK